MFMSRCLCRGHSGRRKVAVAHMELAEPSIGAAVAKCVAEGYKKVVVAPYFLSRGRHITSDIPAMVAEAQKAHPEVSCVIAEPIGVFTFAHAGLSGLKNDPMNVIFKSNAGCAH